jgi:hypothetical protein
MVESLQGEDDLPPRIIRCRAPAVAGVAPVRNYAYALFIAEGEQPRNLLNVPRQRHACRASAIEMPVIAEEGLDVGSSGEQTVRTEYVT